jgi:steroid delta-isomerase-like uncharacterized protein
MLEENKNLAYRHEFEIIQEGKLEVADEILAPDYVAHVPGLAEEWLHGPEGTKKAAISLRAAFPDMQITYEDVIAEGDRVAVRWSMIGTHRGEAYGIPATGKEVAFAGISIYRFAEGKIAELWQHWDEIGVRRQLGALPPPD